MIERSKAEFLYNLAKEFGVNASFSSLFEEYSNLENNNTFISDSNYNDFLDNSICQVVLGGDFYDSLLI